MFKKAVSLTLAVLLLLPEISFGADKWVMKIDLGKLKDYGTSYAEYVIADENNDPKAALKELATSDVSWDLGGKALEFLVNDDPNALPEFKSEITDTIDLVKKIGEVSAQLGSENYSDAAITAIDIALGQSALAEELPLIKVLWEAIKLTIESAI